MKKLIISALALLMVSSVALAGSLQESVRAVIAKKNAADVTAPTVSTATIGTNGTTLTLGMSETVTRTAGTFDVDCTTAGNGLTCTYSSGSGSNSLVYTIGTTVNSGDTCNLDYDGAANGIEDGAGNDLAAITNGAVTNNSTQGGAAAYYYPGGSSTFADSYYPANSFMQGSPIVCGQTGDITKIAVYIHDNWSIAGVKVALYNQAGTLHEGQTVATPASTAWAEVTLASSLACTENDVVKVAFETSGSCETYQRTTTDENSDFYKAIAYASFPPANLSGSTAEAAFYHPVRIYVEP